MSDFIATLNYHSHVEADNGNHTFSPPRQICRAWCRATPRLAARTTSSATLVRSRMEPDWTLGTANHANALISNSSFLIVERISSNEGYSGAILNRWTACAQFGWYRGLRRPARPNRSSRAPHRHDFDARAFTRALYRGGRNHVGPANVLSCDSRPPASTQQSSLRPSVAILRLGRKFSKIPHCAAAGIYDIIYAFTVKALMKTKKTSDRISEIVAEMHSITEFAEGSISSSSNSYPVKDGTPSGRGARGSTRTSPPRLCQGSGSSWKTAGATGSSRRNTPAS